MANIDDRQDEEELAQELSEEPVKAKKPKRRAKKASVEAVDKVSETRDIVDISNFEEESQPVMPNNQYTASRSNSIAQSRANRRIKQGPK